MRPSPHLIVDGYAWNHTNPRSYTVKSGYELDQRLMPFGSTMGRLLELDVCIESDYSNLIQMIENPTDWPSFRSEI
ncbi:unnamed protein product, partial [Thlaspi arvense]